MINIIGLIILPLVVLVMGTIVVIGAHRRRTGMGQDEGERRATEGADLLARFLYGNPTRGAIRISQIGMWHALCLVSVLVSMSLQFRIDHYGWWLLATVLLVCAAFAACFKVVPEEPPHRAVYILARTRTETEFSEGVVFVVPLLEKLFPINVTKRDYDAMHPVRTSDNAELASRVQIAWCPDRDHLIRYMQVGKRVERLLDGLVERALRQFYYNQMVPMPKVRREMVDTKLVKDLTLEQRELLAWEAENVEKGKRTIDRDGVYVYFFRVVHDEIQEPWEAAQAVEDEIEKQLLDALTVDGRKGFNKDIGSPDNQNWGIRILGVYPGIIRPAGRTALAADRKAEEIAQRRAEVYETETETQQARVLMKIAHESTPPQELSFDEAIKIILDFKTSREGRGFATPSLSVAAGLFAKVLAQYLASRKG